MWNDGKRCLVIEVFDMDTPVPTRYSNRYNR